ncbi:MAG: SET domain-containing protein-lysine N-methyltransferase [Candidatus Nomurabacteria bacterium]|nr:SET domain-containing protein-lysine N-methyltransferase [Candidatus Nomurabacteria bacterium]
MKNKTPKLKKKSTGKYGNGFYADEDIKKGTIIHMFTGKRMDVKELVQKVNSNKENIDDPFQIGKRTYIDLDEVSRTFNHSCDPNCGIRKVGEMFSLRDIKKGEEITYDYSLTIAPTEWKMKCLCKSKNCRKILGDINSVSKKQLDSYKKFGALQNYMKKLLKEIESGNYKVPKYEIEALNSLKI